MEKIATSWKLVCKTLALVHYPQLEKRSLPSHPSQVATRQVTSFLCLGFCFLSSWPQQGLVCVLCFHISHSDCSGCRPSKDSCKFKPEVILKPIYLCPKHYVCHHYRKLSTARWKEEGKEIRIQKE